MANHIDTPRRRHVLIVDDDIPLAWAFKETLEHRGYDATIVPDGALALKFVLEHALDAVVCDLEVCGLEGDLLFAAIERSNPSLAHRFVFIHRPGDHSRFRNIIQSLELRTLHKPVAIEALLDEVVRVAEGRPT